MISKKELTLSLKSIRDFAKKKLTDEEIIALDERDECPLDIVRTLCSPDKIGIQRKEQACCRAQRDNQPERHADNVLTDHNQQRAADGRQGKHPEGAFVKDPEAGVENGFENRHRGTSASRRAVSRLIGMLRGPGEIALSPRGTLTGRTVVRGFPIAAVA